MSAPDKAAVVRARGLSKAFGDTSVLRDIDLDIAAGQFVSIVGRSGCGKSTLLRLIMGLDQPTGGTLEIDGGPGRIMFQEARLLPWAKVAANVAVGLGGREGPEVADALAEVGLADRAGEWPGALSGGQRQRVALARALVSRPRLLALDEPLGALDALTRIDMQALIERVWREQGFTTVLVTHDVAEAVMLSDRVLLVEDGGISLDLAIDLPRPRRRGDPAFAALEGQILDRLMARPA
jgi:sulfonate transport system ATP-binding protein